MKTTIDLNSLLAPIPGENPAGEDLRYSPIYDDLKEARRADDQLERGEWQREIKTSDWDKVISLASDALSKKSKDLQIAAWLTEALIRKEGFSGLAAGLKLLLGLLQGYWENVYPVIEEGDLEFRGAPLQFLNDKVSSSLKEVPLTDPSATPGYSWLKWQESREVGAESDTLTRQGGVDESKKKRREELIAEKKLTAEEFDSAVARTSKAFYQSLVEDLTQSRKTFQNLDRLVEEKFGSQGPRLSDFGEALEECARVVTKIFKEQKGGGEPAAKPGPQKAAAAARQPEEKKEEPLPLTPTERPSIMPSQPVQFLPFPDTDSQERAFWEEALGVMKASGIREALAKLLTASDCAPSVRARNRYRLLMARLCLEADRPDLARPIMEELNHLIEELHLERWESPRWIAEVLEALYQCLTRGQPSDEDLSRGKTLFQRLCTTDVTKAIVYKG
jgi:type VI secretion system protein ImpA